MHWKLQKLYFCTYNVWLCESWICIVMETYPMIDFRLLVSIIPCFPSWVKLLQFSIFLRVFNLLYHNCASSNRGTILVFSIWIVWCTVSILFVNFHSSSYGILNIIIQVCSLYSIFIKESANEDSTPLSNVIVWWTMIGHRRICNYTKNTNGLHILPFNSLTLWGR